MTSPTTVEMAATRGTVSKAGKIQYFNLKLNEMRRNTCYRHFTMLISGKCVNVQVKATFSGDCQ